MSQSVDTIPGYYKFLSAAFSGAGATLICYPMEFLKIRMQVYGLEGGGGVKITPLDLAKFIHKNEGFAAFYNGLSASVTRQILYTGTRMGIFQVLLDYFSEDGKPASLFVKSIVGVGAGMIGGAAGVPPDICMVRMAADGNFPTEKRRNYKGIADAILRIAKEEGYQTLYRGFSVTVARAGVATISQLVDYFTVIKKFAGTFDIENCQNCAIYGNFRSLDGDADDEPLCRNDYMESWSLKIHRFEDELCKVILVAESMTAVYFINSFGEPVEEITENFFHKVGLISHIYDLLKDKRIRQETTFLCNIETHNPVYTKEFLNKNIIFVVNELMKLVPNFFIQAPLKLEVKYLLNLYFAAVRNFIVPHEIVTTDLVSTVFNNFFYENKSDQPSQAKPCGICTSCLEPDCGRCTTCQKMLSGEPGSSSRNCEKRKCIGMSQETNFDSGLRRNRLRLNTVSQKKEINWIGTPLAEYEDPKQTHYGTVHVGSMVIQAGDFVLVKQAKQPSIVAHVHQMWRQQTTSSSVNKFHASIFVRSKDTILGSTGYPWEIFQVNKCRTFELKNIISKAVVINTIQNTFENWNGQTFHCNSSYSADSSRFEKLDTQLGQSPAQSKCPSCEMKAKLEVETSTKFDEGILYHKNVKYSVGSAVYLNPYSICRLYTKENEENEEEEDFNESEYEYDDIYTELYRKKTDKAEEDVKRAQPFCIGKICNIYKIDKKIMLRIQNVLRPEDISDKLRSTADLKEVFWTSIQSVVDASKVEGKCYLSRDVAWSNQGPNRFFYQKGYDIDTKTFYDATTPEYALLGSVDVPEEWPTIEPLKCLDVFAGCGAFSEGLKQVNAVEVKWAIENDPCVALSYKINNPETNVCFGDANMFLARLIAGTESNLPANGEIDIIISGPPCQGFSGMNRFSQKEKALMMNSLIMTCLGYLDFYRPKYFIFENVKKILSNQKGMVVKLILRSILAMGYQVTFGALQAGNYGVPQQRSRAIIIAAAPNCVLPHYPEPLTCFNKTNIETQFNIQGVQYSTGLKWKESAPYRSLCVQDAISDLPVIYDYGTFGGKIYETCATTHYQRLMRKSYYNGSSVSLHFCKKLTDLQIERIKFIPMGYNFDWRNLPNKSVKLRNGTFTDVLVYKYRCNGQKKVEPLRGVCRCASGGICDPGDNQPNTLIPWAVCHTADKHSNWKGIYGRLSNQGHFGTTTSNLDPFAKQGRVVHPTQNRVLTVRECARSQGIPDQYYIFGNIKQQYKQIANALPPPLAAAIGQEIKKAFAKGPV